MGIAVSIDSHEALAFDRFDGAGGGVSTGGVSVGAKGMFVAAALVSEDDAVALAALWFDGSALQAVTASMAVNPMTSFIADAPARFNCNYPRVVRPKN